MMALVSVSVSVSVAVAVSVSVSVAVAVAMAMAAGRTRGKPPPSIGPPCARPRAAARHRYGLRAMLVRASRERRFARRTIREP
ncbi:hypothetical protein AQ756_07605 [Burkholderia pseudomallei]|nr:hypothetical protein AQ756_07605 [Burkholderia pseudomallei]OMT71892.1 hypothetical protein AQ763_25980 [Burkholderia pseudomallei]